MQKKYLLTPRTNVSWREILKIPSFKDLLHLLRLSLQKPPPSPTPFNFLPPS